MDRKQLSSEGRPPNGAFIPLASYLRNLRLKNEAGVASFERFRPRSLRG